ncbi:MDR family NADP-dependent oxidoreductase [Streptomyces subrutilus]|uniref:NADP-dependent oxidoreductase n=1 Tax=Streptomyces subrutilus TaxID=36818 RepID=A0A5P2UW48_9ACTN|nr:NADP-dependent oxidoreductase [Streptomyces subrutilus]QEU81754.1 NADP-dependent oxidoreductase [Streptomyces subrutilus]WSJ28815.1 NADP-dependent oxidoreductase [Streptomyces subrutilus]GGZ93312.1 NADP-dependent oxidoreductase [Streptomyces subrutilus]
MSASLPRTTREVRLASVPVGLPTRDHFVVTEAPLPEPGADRVLVRNRHFLVFPGLRTLIGGEVDGVPLPALRPGDALFGPCVGEVVAAPAGGPLRPGDVVAHLQGWREYALVSAAECAPLGDALPDPVAHLAQGSTAYGALTRLAGVREGDVVFVTGAAGAVGSLAGQIARLLGARRVIGSTGSPWKAERLVAELGYDAVVLRGAGSVADQLAAVAPEGIDVLVDTVAGGQLTAALGAARHGARFALVGALSGQLSARRAGGSAPVEIDAFRLVVKGVSLRGYSGADHPDVEEEWTGRFGAWLRSGEIAFPHVRIAGIDRAPQALQELIEGRHFGAVVVEL